LKVLIVYNSSRITHDKNGNLILDTNIISTVEAVEKALEAKGYLINKVALKKNFKKFIAVIEKFKPDIIFNLCEMINNNAMLEKNAVAVYEIVNLPFTGNTLTPLYICLNKALTKRFFNLYKIPTPKFRILNNYDFDDIDLKFPLIVKPGLEDGSKGISAKSVVKNLKALKKRVKFIITKYKQFALVEEFIQGKELHISLIGNKEPDVLAIAELDYKGLPKSLPKICSYAAKWQTNSIYYKYTNPILPARINIKLYNDLSEMAKFIYKKFMCKGYARIDLRLKKGKPYFLEVNPNPDISPDAGFAKAAKYAGLPYEDLINRIVLLGLEKSEFNEFY